MPFYSEKERILLHPAYILHHRPYRNTSLLLDVLTRDHGRLSLVAKGAKQSKSQFRGCMQPFQKLSISWVRKTELGTLTHAEISDRPNCLVGEAMFAAMYVNELLTRVLVNGEHSNEIFTIYSKTLRLLSDLNVTLNENAENSLSIKIAPVLRVFEYELLQSLGFEIQLEFDVEQRPINVDLMYKYIPEHGFVQSQEKNVLLFQGKYLLAFKNEEFQIPGTLKVAQRLMHSGLHKLLGEKPLKSRELFKAYRQLEKM